MGKYLDLVEAAERARRSPTRTPQAKDQNTASGAADYGQGSTLLTGDTETCRLVAADWKPKVRLGKTIWQRPDTGFWVSQEMALRLLERWGAKEGQKA